MEVSKRYSLVQFEDGYLVVLTKWIFKDEDKEHLCFYPPNHCDVAIKELADPEESWIPYNVNILLSSDKLVYLRYWCKRWEDEGMTSETNVEAKRRKLDSSSHSEREFVESFPLPGPSNGHFSMTPAYPQLIPPCPGSPEPRFWSHTPSLQTAPRIESCQHIESWFQRIFDEIVTVKELLQTNHVFMTNDTSHQNGIVSLLPASSTHDLMSLANILEKDVNECCKLELFFQPLINNAKSLNKAVNILLEQLALPSVLRGFNLTGKNEKTIFPPNFISVIEASIKTNSSLKKQMEKQSVRTTVSERLKHMKKKDERRKSADKIKLNASLNYKTDF